jgi:outer membrane receptor for ferrienterochelin and colicins
MIFRNTSLNHQQMFFHNSVKGILFLCILVFLFYPAVVNSEEGTGRDITELSLEELMNIKVYGASKYEQKATEAPSSVSIITSDEIKKYGYRTLAELLQSVRGFYVTYDRNYRYLGLRGFSPPTDFNSRVLLLVDGVRTNDNIYNGAMIGTEFILDVDLIDRVEIIRGPSSSLYGSNAFFGVINVITKNGSDLKGAELSGAAGTFDTYTTRLSYGNTFKNGLDMIISGTYYTSDGEDHLYFRAFDDPATNNGVAEDLDGDRYYSLFAKVSYQDFTLEGAFIDREKDIPTASYDTLFNMPGTKTIDGFAFIDLKYAHMFGNNLDMMARVNYNHTYYDGDYQYDYADPGDPPYVVTNKDYARGTWLGAEVQVNKTLFEKHRLNAGVEFRNNIRQQQKNYDEEVYLDDKRDSTFWAVFIQDEFRILKNLILNAGIRHDHYENFGGTTNPRIALLYKPWEMTVCKLLYGQAFRAPNAYELYYTDGERQKPNPDLDPETIETYELVIDQFIGKSLRGSVSGFFYRIEDHIVFQTDPEDEMLVFRNLDEVKAHGIELELEGMLENGIKGRISYAFQESENRQTGQDLANSPQHLAKLNLILPVFRENIFLGIEEQYTSERKTVSGTDIDGYFLTNVTLFSKNLLKNLEASVSVYNLLNEKYEDPGSQEHLQDTLEQNGCSVRAKITYVF